ncbi:phosphonate C-P lyase system protein PhnL [Pseudodesulfovibrio indicus]|uniref:Alpha-D-ribose 1-methylphosphonate 5-triphosphate synthase subunit PhnL n=1 Tax=Pseudodesulfovibrio indicus TaxID=1716143 RepID=A0A126QJN2_9BACT|nr:phosphonate C-P lyase system protein PhnL [Pseudodesulfovibrio indicus]AMK10212.1 phosphonate ABC transporter ATP-binding protein [Pseudodesulfovibrio indicus]TDT87920.1 alpha-D-ribose 1-methylphosphonate 5-triphosphate synthase subunit PhnL [Pseudodesulfovibrio indicus]
MTIMISVRDLDKTFTLHTQGGTVIPVFSGLNLDVRAGECVALAGSSGSGKSSLICSLYGNYRPQSGAVSVRHQGEMVDIVTATPRQVLDIRARTMGYVSQFLRVVPRVGALDVVAEPLVALTGDATSARDRATFLLRRLNIPSALWNLPPATFSGGEQQRVNIARGFSVEYPVLLLDEPTASLDAENRRVVVRLINEAKARGTAVVGIFHDEEVRDLVADRLFEMRSFKEAA